MKLYINGEGNNVRTHEIVQVDIARVVGVIDLGANNADNIYGWSGIKAVVVFQNELFMVDHPENCIIKTDDDIFIHRSNEYWWPSLEEADKYGLFVYPDSCRQGFY